MAKAPVRSLPDEATLARYAGYSKLRRDKDGNVIGVLHTAFQLRIDESYLSAAHLDHFQGDRGQKLSALKAAYDPHPLKILPNGAFTLGITANIKSACAAFDRPVRIVNAPSKNLDCYVQVRQFKSDLLDLLNHLADEIWSDFTLAKDIR